MVLKVNQLSSFGKRRGGPITSLAFQSSAQTPTGAGNSTITLPADIALGDLLVIADSATGAATPGAVTPSGWTNAVTSTTATGIRGSLLYKLADGTEGGTVITGMAGNGGGAAAKVFMGFRGDNPAVSLTVGGTNAQGTGNNPTAQTVAASGQATPLVILGLYTAQDGVANFVNPRTFTVGGSPAKDGELEAVGDSTFNHDLWLAYKIYNASPADASIDMDDENFQVLMSCYIRAS